MSNILLDPKEYVNKYRRYAKHINDECYTTRDVLSHFHFPIYYLFDHKINSELGMDPNNRTYLRRTLNLDRLFSINPLNIKDISITRHSTLFYKFSVNDRDYLYYSNSGFGINNQLNKDNVTSCKIIYFSKKYNYYYNNLPQRIEKLIDGIGSLGSFSRNNKNKLGKSDVDILRDNLISTSIKLTNDEYTVLSDFIIGDNKNNLNIIDGKNKLQTLCYAILNYIVYRINKRTNFSYKDVYECSFNHVLTGHDELLHHKQLQKLSFFKFDDDKYDPDDNSDYYDEDLEDNFSDDSNDYDEDDKENEDAINISKLIESLKEKIQKKKERNEKTPEYKEKKLRDENPDYKKAMEDEEAEKEAKEKRKWKPKEVRQAERVKEEEKEKDKKLDEKEDEDNLKELKRLEKKLVKVLDKDKKRIVNSKGLITIINNCYNDFNNKIFKDSLNRSKIPNDRIQGEFSKFIDQINIKLNLLENPTIQYKLKNTFILEYNNIHGIFNKTQQAGSCTFYSYYNLAINMKLLNIFNRTQTCTEENVNEFICAFVEFHYIMIFLLCNSNDMQYIPDKLRQYDPNSIYNNAYIDRLINENNLLGEILNIYQPNNTLLFNPKKILIDYTLEKEISGTVTKFESIKLLNNNIQFTELFICIDEMLFDIRNGVNISPEEINNNMNTIFEPIISKCTDITNGDNLFTYLADSKNIRHIGLYFNILKTMYVLYFIILVQIYNTIDLKTDLKKIENTYNFNLLNMCLPISKYNESKNLSKDKCEANPSPPPDYRYLEINNGLDGNDQRINLSKKNSILNDFLLSHLNFNEIINISKVLEDSNFINNSKLPLSLGLVYHQYIYIGNFRLSLSNYYKPLDLSFNITFNNFTNNIYHKNNLYNYIDLMMNKYVNCKQIINNNKIEDSIKKDYKNIIKNIQENILDVFINIIDDNTSERIIDEKENDDIPIIEMTSLSLFIIIITDSKYILHPYSDSGFMNDRYIDILKLFLIINENTNIYSGKFLLNKQDCIYKLLPILKEIKINYSKIDSLIKEIINYISTNIDKIKWINELNFTIPLNDTDFYKYNNEPNEYYSIDFITKKQVAANWESIIRFNGRDFTDANLKNGIHIILARFGIDIEHIARYIILFPCEDLNDAGTVQKFFEPDDNDSLEEYDPYQSAEKVIVMNYKFKINITKSTKFFILINEFNKCIEVHINADGKVNLDECYIFDKNNKDKKDKLLFNLDKQKFPFLSLIPPSAPYLCYKRKHEYFLEFIITPKNNDMMEYFLYNNRKINVTTDLYVFKIAPSMLFITIDSFNNEKYDKLYEIYEMNHIKKIPNNIMRQEIILTNEYLNNYRLCEIISEIYDKLSKEAIYDETRIDEFRRILNVEINNNVSRKAVFESFINENRFCNFVCPSKCEYYGLIIAKLNSIKDQILNTLHLDKIINNASNCVTDFIINNFDKFLILMEINILIKTLSIVNSDTNCWDIGYVLTTLKSIIYFNETISKKFYYRFELLFLLQNEYFFKETQMRKYDEIRHDLVHKNSDLKLHQFMMGKGKTSVFTPLLSFAVHLLTDKKPNIITVQHLVKQTKKFMYFTEKITNLKTNIFSDFDAKKRWLEYTDVYLKENNQKLVNNIRDKITKEKQKKNKNTIKILEDKLNDIQNININNEINIIDEFDYHHNYLQSMFNYVQKKDKILEDLYNYIFDYTYEKIRNDSYTGDTSIKILNPYNKLDINMELLNDNLNNVYEQSKTMVFNEHFGFSFLILKEEADTIWRICSPFARKDTPVKDSNFSNVLLRLILTFKIYLSESDYNKKLQDFDYENIGKNKTIFNKLLPFINNLIDETDASLFLRRYNSETLNNIKQIFNKIYLNPLTDPLKILKKYLFIVNETKINITLEQRNMSFQDIIYNNYNQLQVGYTGTASLKLNIYKSNEKFVFKKIIEDFDEKIEVTLALNKYGAPDNNINVSFINKDTPLKESIIQISEILGEKARGFVDLIGKFVNDKNEDVAEELKNHYKDTRKIVYINLDDVALEYKDKSTLPTKYIPEDEANFFYYDQCHTIGTDLKQSRVGHIGIIINNTTRWTDFAQAIFRFRKLNRGTYLTVIYMYKEETEKAIYKTNNEINKLLKENEEKFNDDQCNGLKYQLLKTMVRKDSKNYCEDKIIPEFFKEEKYNLERVKNYMKDNIHNLNEYLRLEKPNFILQNYSELTSINENELISLVIGSQNMTELEQEQEGEQDEEQENQKQRKKLRETIKETVLQKLNSFFNNTLYCIEHLNCQCCDKYNCIKLFKKNDILINNKNIYISYNFRNTDLLELSKNKYKYEETGTGKDFSGRFCYVEFNDKILIEKETIALEYYLYKLPVYDYTGKLLVPYMGNLCNLDRENPLKYSRLDIDIRFIKLLGIENYIDPNVKKIIKPDIDIIKILNPIGFLLLSYHFLIRITDRYNIDLKLLEKINNIDVTDYTGIHINIERKRLKKLEHTTNPNNDIRFVFFNQYKKMLMINDDGYENKISDIIPPIKYRYTHINYDSNYKTHTTNKKIRGINVKEFDRTPTDFSLFEGGYYYKYMKYKEKYLDLKSKII